VDLISGQLHKNSHYLAVKCWILGDLGVGGFTSTSPKMLHMK